MGDPEAHREPALEQHGLALPAVFILLSAALGSYLWLLMTPGTSDVSAFWLHWIDLMRQHGLVDGYRLADSDYMPLAFAALRGVDLAAASLGLETLLGLKLGLTLAALVSATVFWWRGRNLWHTAGLLFALLVSTVAQGSAEPQRYATLGNSTQR